MTKTSLLHSFAKYVSLNILGMVGLSCYILADTFFVAQGVGVNGLAALNFAIPVYSFIQGAGLMVGIGGATRFSISRAQAAFTQSLYYTALLSLLFLGLALVASPLAVLLGADSLTLPHASTYLRTILCFAPMFLLNNVVLCFVRNDGNPQLAMLAMLCGSFANILLDYLFIFPLGMGMFGAALATGIAPVISLLLLALHFVKKKNTFSPTWLPLQLPALADISCLGASALVTECSSGIVIITFNYLVLGLAGNTGVAAYGIVANIALVVVAIFTGIAQGMQPLISRFHGMGQPHHTKRLLRYGLLTAVALACVVYFISFTFAAAITGAFNRDGDPLLTAMATGGLRIYFAGFFFAGVNILCAAYYSAVDVPRRALIVSLLRGGVIILPVAWGLSCLLGITGIWVAMPVAELLVTLVCAGMLAQGAKKGLPQGN